MDQGQGLPDYPRTAPQALKHATRTSANRVICLDRHISTDREGGGCWTPAVGGLTIWHCKQTQAGLTESQSYTKLHGVTVLHIRTHFPGIKVSTANLMFPAAYRLCVHPRKTLHF